MTKERVKMKPGTWRGVDIQASLFTAVVMILLTSLIFWFQYRITYNDTLVSLGGQAEVICGYMEKRPDKSAFDQVWTREDMEGGVYKRVYEAFRRIREISSTRYPYTVRMNEDGKLVYLIDCLDQSEPDFCYPGDLIEHEIYPDMQRTLGGQEVLPNRIKDTKWGKVFITYMPIYDEEQVLGVVGIEFEVGHQYDTYRSLRLLLPLFVLLFSLGACLASRLLFRRMSNPFYRDMSNMGYLIQLKNQNACQLDIGNHTAGKAQEGTGFILLDLSGLKHVNDILGHDVEDIHITYVSKAYPNTRAREAVVYRIGDDEFAVVMPDADQNKIQDFMRRLGDTFNKEASMPEFTFSWGYSIYDPKADVDLYSTCHRTDKSVHMRKRQYCKSKNI